MTHDLRTQLVSLLDDASARAQSLREEIGKQSVLHAFDRERSMAERMAGNNLQRVSALIKEARDLL